MCNRVWRQENLHLVLDTKGNEMIATQKTFDIKGYRFDENRVQHLLCTALEGGSNYWIENVITVMPKGHKPEDYMAGGQHNIDDEIVVIFDCPLYNAWRFEGGMLRFGVDMEENERITLHDFTMEKAINGLKLMAEGGHCRDDYWPTFLTDNGEDADFADCWLQLAVFGEIIFG